MNTKFLFSLLTLSALSTSLEAKKPKPVQVQEENDDEMDKDVLLSGVANILVGFGNLPASNGNPAIVGPSLAQIGVGIVNIIWEMFKNNPSDFRRNFTHEEIAQYYEQLPVEGKMRVIALVLEYYKRS